MSDNNCMSPICNNQAVSIGYCQECLNVFDDIPKPPTVTISRECAERSHARVSYYLDAAYNKAVGPEALKDFNELTKALEVTG